MSVEKLYLTRTEAADFLTSMGLPIARSQLQKAGDNWRRATIFDFRESSALPPIRFVGVG